MSIRCTWYHRMPLNRQVGMWLLAIMISCLVLVTVGLQLQLYKTRYAQEQMPRNFFTQYNEYSMRETAYGVKRMILSVYDYRVGFLNNLKQLMLRNYTTRASDTLPTLQTLEDRSKCILSSNSTFSCGLDSAIITSLEEEWALQKRHPLKRLNMIYMSNTDDNDYMVRTISSPANAATFRVRNVTQIRQNIESLQQGFSQYSGLLTDYYADGPQPICYIHTKINYGNYTVLFELQTFANFMSISLRRVLYSSSANIVVVFKNSSAPKGYSYFASLRPLQQQQVNYSSLLESGFHESYFPNGSLFQAYTAPMSSKYKLGIKSFVSTNNVNQDVVVIVHSVTITAEMQNRIYEITTTITGKCSLFNGLSFAAIAILAFSISGYMAHKINSVLRIATQCISGYLRIGSIQRQEDSAQKKSGFQKLISDLRKMTGQKEQFKGEKKERKRNRQYLLILKHLLQFEARQQFFYQTLRKLYMTIMSIEGKMKKTKAAMEKEKRDSFPLNLYQQDFMESQRIPDEILYERLYSEIQRSQAKQKSHK